MSHATRPLLVLALAVTSGVFHLGGSCSSKPAPPPVLRIDAPANGTFTEGSSIVVHGYARRGGQPIVELTVNGLSALPLVGSPNQGTWSIDLPLDTATVLNPVVAELHLAGGQVLRERITVIAGESIADGDLSPESILMRFNDSGLDDLEPVVTSLVPFDPATLLPVGTEVLDDCFVTFIGCIGSARVTIANPPPTISGFGIDVDSLNGFAAGDVAVHDLAFRLFVDGSGVVPNCHVNINATVTNIFGDYDLSPNASVPSEVDVNQVGAVSVAFQGFGSSYEDLCDAFLIGDIIQAIIGDIQPMVRDGFQSFLNDPDGGGPQDGPIADAIEIALAEVDIAGPLSDAIGQTLTAEFFTIDEDALGITFGSDGGFTANPNNVGACFGTATGEPVEPLHICSVKHPCPDPNHECRAGPDQCLAHVDSPDFTASYHVSEPFPVLGSLTPPFGDPPTAQPYGLGLGISSSAFNQLLRAQLECGLLTQDIREVPSLGALSRGLLGLFIPEIFSFSPPGTLFELRLRPQVAPVVTGSPGPDGELAELRIGGLQVELVDTEEALPTAVVVQVDTTVGLDADFAGGEIAFLLGTNVQAEDIGVTLTTNNLGAQEADLVAIIQGLFTFALPELAGALEGFPLPAFLGLQLENVSVDRAGEFMTLYLDLAPAP